MVHRVASTSIKVYASIGFNLNATVYVNDHYYSM